MARRRYLDYKASDATRLLNEWKRGILVSGIYSGFAAVPAGDPYDPFAVSLLMDEDPDTSGGKLGSIITRDSVVIQEDEDLVNVATANAAHPTLPRVDYLVATYVYNASTPNNDVTYSILEGTPGTLPTPPSLNDHQLVLAELHIPAAATALTTSMVQGVSRKSLFQGGTNFDGILREGVYSGGLLSKGSASNKLSISAMVAVTPELRRVATPSLTDKFTIPDAPSANHGRYDWVILASKSAGLASDEYDLILVTGTAALEGDGAGTLAKLPTDEEIATAVVAFNGKYSGSTMDYVTKVGYIFVKGPSTSMEVNYHHTSRALQDLSFYVSSGNITPAGYMPGLNSQVWPFVGVEGLQSALSLIRTLVNSMYVSDQSFRSVQKSSIKVLVDGDFRFFNGQTLGVPSYTELQGVGPTVLRFQASTSVQLSVLLGGFSLPSGTALTIKDDSDGVPQTGVPGGYKRIEVGIAVADKGELTTPGLSALRLSGSVSGGDEFVMKASGGAAYKGWFEDYTTTVLTDTEFTFRAIVQSGYNKASSTLMYLMKTNNGLKDITVALEGTKSSTTLGALYAASCDSMTLENVTVPGVRWGVFNRKCRTRNLRVSGYNFNYERPASAEDALYGYGNIYDGVDIVSDYDISSVLGSFEKTASVSLLQASKSVSGSGTVTLGFLDSSIDVVDISNGFSASPGVVISSKRCSFGSVNFNARNPQYPVASVSLTGEGNNFSSVRTDAAATLSLAGASPGGQNSFGKLSGFSLSYANTYDRKNYELFYGAKNRDEDLNLSVTSSGSLSWDQDSETLSWDSDLLINLPYSDINNKLIAGSVTLAVDTCMYVVLKRDASVLETLSPVVVGKTSYANLRNSDVLVLAKRTSSGVYLLDGTYLVDGVPCKLGESTPPDNSITVSKFSKSAKEFFTSLSLSYWFEQVNPKSLDLRSIAYGSNGFVAVGQADSDAYILHSSDGTVWSEITAPGAGGSLTTELYSVIFSGGLYIAVGSRSDGTSTVITSSDGLAWSLATLPAPTSSRYLKSIAYSGSMYVGAGSSDGTRPEILSSPDLVTWTRRTAPAGSQDIESVVYANGKFVAVGSPTATSAYIATSPDGITWTQRSSGSVKFFGSLVFFNNLFMASDNATSNSIMTSPDGISWSSYTPVAPDPGVLRVANGVLFLTTIYGAIYFSFDGVTWNRRPTSKIIIISDISYGQIGGSGLYTAVGSHFLNIGGTPAESDAYILTSSPVLL